MLPVGGPIPPVGRPHVGTLRVVSAAPPAVRAPADLVDIAGAADVIEIRFDLLLDRDPDLAVASWVAASPRPVLATVRSRAQGGAYTGSPEDAAALLRKAAEAGAAWVDVEARVAPHLGALPDGVRRVASVHGPAELDAPAPERGDADLLKVARPVDTTRQFLDLLAEAAAAEPQTFFVPYGTFAATRVLFAARPGVLLFGAGRADAQAARGQPTLDVLLDELRAGEITPDAALYGLVGDPPARSPSPAMHNGVFRATGRDALYVPLPGVSLDEAIGLPFVGFSVTHPYKTRALELADHVDTVARAVGAANTLVRRDDGWWAGNTDATGLRGMLPDAKEGGRAFVYGAGGYARAAVWALRERGYEVRLGARDDRAGPITAATCGAAWAGPRYVRQEGDRVVVNATPAGASGEPVPAFEGVALAGLLTLDAPYREGDAPTGLVAQATAEGAAYADGRFLLQVQAHDQAEAFDAAAADVLLIWALRTAVEVPPTLVLLGARGAGKTSVGRRLARLMGRPFVDLDDEVGRVTGRSAADWIRAEGWEAFRDVECELLSRALARRGIVLATGGGVVEHAASRTLLSDAGVRVHLAVEAGVAARRVAASAEDRPRWPGAAEELEEAEMLLERRGAWWSELAEHTVNANNALDDVVEEVRRFWQHGHLPE